MISPTLLGKLKNSRAIRIKWCGTEPYALARSSHVVLFCPFWLRVLSSISFVNVPGIRGSQLSQPSGQMCLYNDCLPERLSYDEQELRKIFSLLYLGGIVGKNFWHHLTAFPLVSKYHQPDTILVVQSPSSKPTEGGLSFLRTRGKFYITCTISHSCPGHYLHGSYGRNLSLPLVLYRYHQTLPLDLGFW